MRFHAGKEIESCQMVQYCHTTEFRPFLKEYDALRHGELPANQILSGQDQTRIDPTRAPSGKGIAFTQTFVPYELADGGAARWASVSLTPELGEGRPPIRTEADGIDLPIVARLRTTSHTLP